MPVKVVVIDSSDDDEEDIAPKRRRGRKARKVDNDDFVPTDADTSPSDEAYEDLASDEEKTSASEGPSIKELEYESDDPTMETAVVFNENGKPKKESYTCVPKPCGLHIKPREGDLPPLSRLDLIFDDIISRPDQVRALMGPDKYRRLRVATMCSGTESPLLALEMFARAIKNRGWGTLEIEHVFSCEIEPFKQA